MFEPGLVPLRARVGTASYIFARTSASRRGKAGLLAFAMLLLLGVFAEFFASEYPLACSVNDVVYILPAVTHPRSLTGLDNDSIRAQGGFAVLPLVHYGPTTKSTAKLVGPSRAHPFGTDASGRDVFAQTVHGIRTQLGFATLCVFAYVLLGSVLGAFAGYLGGAFDVFAERITDSMSALPSFVFVLCVQAALPRPDLATLFLAIVATRFAEVARLVRTEVVSVSARDFVLAARALGASPFRVLFGHVLPNARSQSIVSATFGLGAVVLLEAQLDFLRVGDPGRFASWGQPMSDARQDPTAYWLLVFPGLFLLGSVVAANLLGGAVRDALDPRVSLRRR